MSYHALGGENITEESDLKWRSKYSANARRVNELVDVDLILYVLKVESELIRLIPDTFNFNCEH